MQAAPPPPRPPVNNIISGLTAEDIRGIVHAVCDQTKAYIDARFEKPAFGAEYSEKAVAGIRDLIEESTVPLLRQIVALEKRLTEYEQSGMRYLGIFSRANSYDRGCVTSHSGASWFCLRSCTGLVPGQAPDAWIMVAKGAPEPATPPRANAHNVALSGIR
jgi:hypothetical protein